MPWIDCKEELNAIVDIVNLNLKDLDGSVLEAGREIWWIWVSFVKLNILFLCLMEDETSFVSECYDWGKFWIFKMKLNSWTVKLNEWLRIVIGVLMMLIGKDFCEERIEDELILWMLIDELLKFVELSMEWFWFGIWCFFFGCWWRCDWMWILKWMDCMRKDNECFLKMMKREENVVTDFWIFSHEGRMRMEEMSFEFKFVWRFDWLEMF